jgi:hypothetical protein
VKADADASLPVVQLPEGGEILHCLLTFIFLLPRSCHRLLEKLWNSYLSPKGIK